MPVAGTKPRTVGPRAAKLRPADGGRRAPASALPAQKVNVRHVQAVLRCAAASGSYNPSRAVVDRPARFAVARPHWQNSTDGLALFRLFRTGPMGGLHAFRQISGRALFQTQRCRGAASVHGAVRAPHAALHRLLRAHDLRTERHEHRADHIVGRPLHGRHAVLPAAPAIRRGVDGGAVLSDGAAVRLSARLFRPRRAAVRGAGDRRDSDRCRHADRFGAFRAEGAALQAAPCSADAVLRTGGGRLRPDLQAVRHRSGVLDDDILDVRRRSDLRRGAALRSRATAGSLSICSAPTPQRYWPSTGRTS